MCVAIVRCCQLFTRCRHDLLVIVTANLEEVSKLTAAGHDVWFGDSWGVITHARTGKQMAFSKKNGVYVLRVWAPRGSSPSPGGSRP